jgi:hypothetical protein
MRIFLIFSFMFMLSSCTTIEVAKGVTKASQSIKTSVNNIINADQKNQGISGDQEVSPPVLDNIIEEMKILEEEEKDEREKIKEQKQIVEVVFLGKTHEEIKVWLGTPTFERKDGNTQTLRFDANDCRLFLFFNTAANSAMVKHIELRDGHGNLINVKKKIQGCYKDLNLT